MTMEVDRRPQPHIGGSMGYDAMRYPQQPQFTNPWQPSTNATAPPAPAPLYSSSYHSPAPPVDHPSTTRAPSMSMGYPANPAASSLGSDLVPARSYSSTCSGSSAPTTSTSYPTAPATHYSPEHQHSVSPYGYDADMSRRSSYQHSNPSRGASFSDEMASARGMVAMANGQDTAPRSIYGTPARAGSSDAYGFSAQHSHHSSISSGGSSYPYYNGSYSGSVDGSSVTDYSSASEDARTLPGTSQMINGFPPEPGTMMTQFNAKVSPSAQKKHKCKICEKRFTRPSSLQTHMYSHTGEKPFACDHDGCGRNFSVVSNLRRHKKVHKEGGDRGSDGEDS